MRSNSLDSKLKAKEVELKRHEQEIADQDEVHVSLMSSKHNTYIIKILFLPIVLYNLLMASFGQQKNGHRLNYF